MIVLQLIQQLLLEHYLRNIYQKKKNIFTRIYLQEKCKDTTHNFWGGGGVNQLFRDAFDY